MKTCQPERTGYITERSLTQNFTICFFMGCWKSLSYLETGQGEISDGTQKQDKQARPIVWFWVTLQPVI